LQFTFRVSDFSDKALRLASIIALMPDFTTGAFGRLGGNAGRFFATFFSDR